MWPSFLAWIMALSLLERAGLVELHQRDGAGAEARPAARHRRRLDRFQQLALRRAVRDGALHVRDHAVLAAAEGEDPDDHHLTILDRQRFALADRQLAQRPARL